MGPISPISQTLNLVWLLPHPHPSTLSKHLDELITFDDGNYALRMSTGGVNNQEISTLFMENSVYNNTLQKIVSLNKVITLIYFVFICIYFFSD